MKKILLLALVFTVASFKLNAQQNFAEQYAQKIAQKMKDSLSLTEAQRTQLYDINIQLQNQKASVWKQYTDEEMVRQHLQTIENTRDSLYKEVLSDQQMILYKQKKKNLVSNN